MKILIPLLALSLPGTATPADPRILLHCSGLLANTHSGPAASRFRDPGNRREEVVYRVDRARNGIETWDEEDRQFRSVCTGESATCRIALGASRFGYTTSFVADGGSTTGSDVVVIDSARGWFRDVSRIAVKNGGSMSTDVTTWTGACRRIPAGFLPRTVPPSPTSSLASPSRH